MLRQMVIFGHQDLSRSPPFPRIDLVLCRNVLIYFTPELQDFVLNQLAFALRLRVGYLMLGKAETARPRLGYYEAISKPWRVYRCVADNELALGTRNVSGFQMQRRWMSRGQPVATAETGFREQKQVLATELSQYHRVNDLLLRFLPVGVVVIDRAYKILSMNTAARRLLGLREVGNEQDFLHAVRGIHYEATRDAIDTVFRQRTVTTLPEVAMTAASDGKERALSLSFVHMQVDPHALELVAVSITDVTEQIQTRRWLEIAQREQADLLAELEAANQRLNQTNRELLDANEQLQVANEELLLTHEELQATNEELQTTNEDLQATNEELQTTNEELISTTAERHALTGLVMNERERLAALVELSPFYIVVCSGSELIIEHLDSRFVLQLGTNNLIGHPFTELAERLWENKAEIVDLVRQSYYGNDVVLSPRIAITRTNKQGQIEDNYFVFTCIPRRDAEGRATGVLVYVADQKWQHGHEAVAERDRLHLIFERTQQITLALYDAPTAALLIANPLYTQLVSAVHQRPADSLIGQRWHTLTLPLLMAR